ncbi:hypothetical protein EGW08_002490 [Elysia chlorotica]|uniref:Uncharacterized protein n=1 Tax=Elysia chlorotica TaxID=188477 RepID=A0A433U7K7_ELYCH|nr:hypothetical protein EGW08_002490 [Elysia chlorotica]
MMRRSSYPLSHFDYTVKMILLGDHSVGKTALLSQLAAEDVDDARHAGNCRCLNFRPNAHVELEVKHHGKRILVKIDDTGGQEKFRSITASYYRGAQGCLIMFDAEQPDTFSSVFEWNRDLETYSNRRFLAKLLVGIHLDSTRKQVTSDQAYRLAAQLEMQFLNLDPNNRKSAVGVVLSLLDLVMVTVQRMPSLTIDIRPSQVLELHMRRAKGGKNSSVSEVADDLGEDVKSRPSCPC